jgi:hypothetical protein
MRVIKLIIDNILKEKYNEFIDRIEIQRIMSEENQELVAFTLKKFFIDFKI